MGQIRFDLFLVGNVNLWWNWVEARGEDGGTINVEPGPIPHSPRAFKAEIQLDSFLK